MRNTWGATEVEQNFVTVIGMSIAYVASFLGMGIAWWSIRRKRRKDGQP